MISPHPQTHFNPMSVLPSPEELPYESFTNPSPADMAFNNEGAISKPHSIARILLSPPVSPLTRLDLPQERSIATRDAILFPDHERTHGLEVPLFTIEEEDTKAIVTSHMSARASRKKQFRELPLPSKDEYALALEFKSQVHRLWAINPKRWLAQEREYLEQDERVRAALKPKSNNGLTRIAPAPVTTTKNTPKAIARTPKTPRVSKAKPAQRTRTSATPDKERVHVRNSTTTTREDRDFNSLPDYSPSISTLPIRANSMKVDWKGSPIDLSKDEHRHLLHEDELLLAANLRLDCATYLTSKRRAFIGVIDKYRVGGEFKKTHCQQACKIDVNKASKLWEAYKKVDWFNPKYFQQYL